MCIRKTCKVCGEEKPVSEFPKNGVDMLGAVRYRADCTVCYNINRKTNSKKGKSSFKKFVSNMKNRCNESVTLTLRDWQDCLVFFKGACAYCGKKQSRSVKLTKDHVCSVAFGGKSEKHNTIPACVGCNSSKQEHNLDKWYHGQKFFDDARYQRIKDWIKGGNV